LSFRDAKEIRDDLPRVIRPDLILTEEGVHHCRNRFGARRNRLTGWLDQTYSTFDNEIIGAPTECWMDFGLCFQTVATSSFRKRPLPIDQRMEWIVARLNQKLAHRQGIRSSRGRDHGLHAGIT